MIENEVYLTFNEFDHKHNLGNIEFCFFLILPSRTHNVQKN